MEIFQIGERQIVNLTPYLKGSLLRLVGVVFSKALRSERIAGILVQGALNHAKSEHPNINEFGLRPPSLEFADTLIKVAGDGTKIIPEFPYTQPVALPIREFIDDTRSLGYKVAIKHIPILMKNNSAVYLWKVLKKDGLTELIKTIPKEIGQVIMRFGGDYQKKLSAMTRINASELIVKPNMLGGNPLNSNLVPEGWRGQNATKIYVIDQDGSDGDVTSLVQQAY
jgi:hypothetical protein